MGFSQHRQQCLKHINHCRTNIQVLEGHRVLIRDHLALFLSLRRYDDCCILLLMFILYFVLICF